jgi:hypothetical protein
MVLVFIFGFMKRSDITNKHARHEITMVKFKSRMRKHRFSQNAIGNFFVFRSHGAPCSCWCCRTPKYRDADRPRNKMVDKT